MPRVKYYSMLKMESLSREDYAMLKGMVEKYDIPGRPSEAYSILLSALLHLAYEVGMMYDAHIEDGTQYIERLVGEVIHPSR